MTPEIVVTLTLPEAGMLLQLCAESSARRSPMLANVCAKILSASAERPQIGAASCWPRIIGPVWRYGWPRRRAGRVPLALTGRP